LKLILNYLADNPEICANLVRNGMEVKSEELARVFAGMYFTPEKG
jgi:hypothetical protein